MLLILVPVPVLYGIDVQNPHVTDADFSWLHHIPSCKYGKRHLTIEQSISTA